jgi:hypothetical protein
VVKHTAREGRQFRDDTTTNTNQRSTKRDESVPLTAEIWVDWEPPPQPWTEWAPSADRSSGPLDSSPRSSGHFTFKSSGLPGPGRRGDGPAERRKRNRPS